MMLGKMADEPRMPASPRHLERLLDYLERYPTLALASGRSREGILRYQYVWEKIASNLNKIDVRVKKNGRSWSKLWLEWKIKVRHKYIQYQRYQAAGDHNPIEFTSSEERLLKILTDNEGNLLPTTMNVGAPVRYVSVNTNNNNNSSEHEVINQNNVNDAFIPKTEPEELPPKKTIDELRRELVEFEIMKQREMFELEKKQKREKHDMDMAILELRRQLLAKELDKT